MVTPNYPYSLLILNTLILQTSKTHTANIINILTTNTISINNTIALLPFIKMGTSIPYESLAYCGCKLLAFACDLITATTYLQYFAPSVPNSFYTNSKYTLILSPLIMGYSHSPSDFFCMFEQNVLSLFFFINLLIGHLNTKGQTVSIFFPPLKI